MNGSTAQEYCWSLEKPQPFDSPARPSALLGMVSLPNQRPGLLSVDPEPFDFPQGHERVEWRRFLFFI